MLKNVTLTLHEETLRAVRIAAAHDGVSMSKWLGRLLERNVDVEPIASEAARVEAKRQAMARFLALPQYKLTDENGNAPNKDWMNDRESLRRFEHPDLHEGFAQQSEVRPLQIVAEPPSQLWDYGPIAPSDK
jgi:hypothetical protein